MSESGQDELRNVLIDQEESDADDFNDDDEDELSVDIDEEDLLDDLQNTDTFDQGEEEILAEMDVIDESNAVDLDLDNVQQQIQEKPQQVKKDGLLYVDLATDDRSKRLDKIADTLQAKYTIGCCVQ